MSRSSKTRFGIVTVLGIGFVLVYIAACSNPQLSKPVEASQAGDENQVAGNEGQAVQQRKTYYPNTEELGSTEMRVISLGTGMPNQRKSQASACWLVELGNGEKFLFDLGTGSVANLSVLEIPYDLVNKVFVGHLHSDHVGDFAAWFIGGWVGGRQKAPYIWGA